jgi:hypothetical protein
MLNKNRLAATAIMLTLLGGAYALKPGQESKEGRRPLVSRPMEKVKEFRAEEPTSDSRKELLDAYNDWARSSAIEITDREVVENDSSFAIYAFYLERG